MCGTEDVAVLAVTVVLVQVVLPHKVVVAFFLVTDGIGGATFIMTVLGVQPTQTDAGIKAPTAGAAETLLPTYIKIGVGVFALIAVALLPLNVIVTGGSGQTDVPSVERVVLHAVAEPIAELDTHVATLLGVAVLVPCNPRPEHLSLDAPAVLLAQREFELEVGSTDTPQEHVRLECRVLGVVHGGLIYRTSLRHINNGVKDNNGILAHDRFGNLCHGCQTGTAQLGQILGLQLNPHAAVVQGTQLALARIDLVVVVSLGLAEDPHHLVLPLLIAGFDHLGQFTPARSAVDYLNIHVASETLLDDVLQRLATFLAQALVQTRQTFRRSAGLDGQLD